MRRFILLMLCFLFSSYSAKALATAHYGKDELSERKMFTSSKDNNNSQPMHSSQADKLKDLILQCRYYKGEAEEPEPSADAPSGFYSFWGYEKLWVEWTLNDDPEIKDFEEWVNFYHLESKDGDKTPLTLKAILLNRFLHWGYYGPPEEELTQFEEWYTEEYLRWKTNGELQTDKQ